MQFFFLFSPLCIYSRAGSARVIARDLCAFLGQIARASEEGPLALARARSNVLIAFVGGLF